MLLKYKVQKQNLKLIVDASFLEFIVQVSADSCRLCRRFLVPRAFSKLCRDLRDRVIRSYVMFLEVSSQPRHNSTRVFQIKLLYLKHLPHPPPPLPLPL